MRGHLREWRDFSPIPLQLRQPEVQQLRPGLRDHDVAGFQIPMNNPLSVSLVECVGDLDGVFEGLVEREASLLQPLLQRVPIHVLHDEVVNPVLFTDVVERADMGMVQAADGLGFALESFA